MNFPHPPRGTCVPGCRMYGYCHDGCGKRTRIWPRSDPGRGFIKGRPSSFIKGHSARYSRRRLSSEPLRAVMIARMPDFFASPAGTPWGQTAWWTEVERRYAARYGLSLKQGERDVLQARRARQIPEVVADRLACFYGLHPALVWPDEWWDYTDIAPAPEEVPA